MAKVTNHGTAGPDHPIYNRGLVIGGKIIGRSSTATQKASLSTKEPAPMSEKEMGLPEGYFERGLKGQSLPTDNFSSPTNPSSEAEVIPIEKNKDSTDDEEPKK